jgi:predicted DNA-binding protein
MAKKKAISFSLTPQANKKLKDLAQKSGFSKSQIIEYVILQILPDPDKDEDIKNLAIDIANWMVENKLKNDKENGQGNSGLIIVNNH